MSIAQTQNAWRLDWASVVVLLLLTLALYQHTTLYLAGLWSHGEYGHGYLVLAISAYLIWNNRQRLLTLEPRPQYWALFGVAAFSLLWLVSALVDVMMLQAVALWLLMLALVWTVLGNQAIRMLAFPILFIGFAIPFWFPLSPVLQNITADCVFWVIRLLSVPALRQDNIIVLPAGTLSIEEACSGLRYLLAALTLGTLYAHMNYVSVRARLIVVTVAAASAILTNILRVFIVVYLGYATDMQHPLVGDHLSLGWYLFGGLVVILLFIDAYLHKKRAAKAPDILDVEPEEVAKKVYQRSVIYYFVFFIGTSLLVSAAPTVVYQVNHKLVGEAINAVSELPPEAKGWLGTVAVNDDWKPVYRGALSQKWLYKKDNKEVVLYVGYYPTQKQGEELINDQNRISNKEVWRALYPRARLKSLGNQQVLEQKIDSSTRKQRLVWYWYNIAGKVTTNKYEAKALQVLGLLTGKPEAFVVAAAVQTDNDAVYSRQVLKDFILSVEKSIKSEMEILAGR